MSYSLLRQIIPAGNTNHPHKTMGKISYITIHCTDTYGTGATARASANYLTNNSQGAQASWHYTVDDLQAVQSFEDTQECWHAGDGTSGEGNSTSIAIEISTNWGFAAKGQTVPGIKTWEQVTAAQRAEAEIKFKKACDNAAQLTADLLKKHGLGTERVVQHNHWKSAKYPTGKNCPYALRQELLGTSWDWFVNLVTKYYSEADTPAEIKKEESNMSFQTGDTVKITGAAAVYTNGKAVPESVKNKPYTVQQVSGDKLLLQEIVSWVYAKDCTLHTAAGTGQIDLEAMALEKAALIRQIASLTTERDTYKEKLDKGKGLAEEIKKL